MSNRFVPRPHQYPIVEHIVTHPRCWVWAGMGMGKTSATLYAIDALDAIDGPGCTLVLAPLRVARSVWPDEVAKWAQFRHLSVSVITGTPTQRTRALNKKAAIYTLNYENLPWLVETLGGRWPFDRIIADESTRLKSFRLGGANGKRARALAKAAWLSRRFVGLTGTPAPNGLQDLWGQAWFVDKGAALGRTYTAFTRRWFRAVTIGAGAFTRLEVMPHAQEEIERLVRPYTISIRPQDWFPDMREPIVVEVPVRLPPAAQRQYDEMQKELFTVVAGHEIEASNAAHRSQKCLQLASGAVYIDKAGAWREVHHEKIDALKSIIEEAAGAPVLVAYHWQSDLARLQAAFPRGVAMDKDPATLRAWNTGQIPILFCHPASAGHGLNLQDGGNILVFFSHWWNLEERQQIIERIGPMRQLQSGHNRAVFIYNIVARGTIDKTVLLRHKTKRDIQDLLVEASRQTPETQERT